MTMTRTLTALAAGLLAVAPTMASEAETSAKAGTGYGGGNAEATARYDGHIGFARTNSRSGPLSLARGLAVGLDENGLSLSASHALSHKSGVAFANNFNITLGRDGQVAVSNGRALSLGAHQRSAEAGGYSGVWNGRPKAASSAYGRSDPGGIVKTRTHARTSGPRLFKPRRALRRGCF